MEDGYVGSMEVGGGVCMMDVIDQLVPVQTAARCMEDKVQLAG